MHLSYPHTQTIIITIVCIIVVAGTGFYVFKQPTTSSQELYASTKNTSVLSLAQSTGDWKKDFYVTSSSTTQSTATVNKLSVTQDNQPLTLTDKLSRDFFARYIQLQQNNLGDNQQLVADSINQTIDTTVQAASQAPVYTLKDIAISANSNTDALHTYGNTVGTIFNLYAPTTSPADVATQAFDKGDMTILEKIDPIIAGCDKVISLLKTVPVPQPLAQYHLDIINAVSSMKYVSQGLRNIQGDPMQSIIALSQYAKTQDALLPPFTSIETYFKKNNVVFGTKESGILFSVISP